MHNPRPIILRYVYRQANVFAVVIGSVTLYKIWSDQSARQQIVLINSEILSEVKSARKARDRQIQRLQEKIEIIQKRQEKIEIQKRQEKEQKEAAKKWWEKLWIWPPGLAMQQGGPAVQQQQQASTTLVHL